MDKKELEISKRYFQCPHVKCDIEQEHLINSKEYRKYDDELKFKGLTYGEYQKMMNDFEMNNDKAKIYHKCIMKRCNKTERDYIDIHIKEIKEELKDYSIPFFSEKEEKKLIVDTLPKDCINLFDPQQTLFYKDNYVVRKSLEFLEKRRLINAINRPPFYLSLTDKVHRNRVIIPFLDENGKILYYQSRTVLESDERNKPRYISKINGDKTIFNFNRLDYNFDKIFIFEGPFNSCFVKNGVAIGGIQENSYQLFTPKQQDQIDRLPFHQRIWVLDSQWIDKAALSKTKKLLELKEKVFIWPKELGKTYKDFNDVVIELKSDHISSDFILKYTK